MFTVRDFGPPGSPAGASEGTGRDGVKKLRNRREAGCHVAAGCGGGTGRVRDGDGYKRVIENRNGRKWVPSFSDAMKRK